MPLQSLVRHIGHTMLSSEVKHLPSDPVYRGLQIKKSTASRQEI